MGGVVGCLVVAAIHVIDQGGVPGTKGPEYIQFMYYASEAAGVVSAALLLTNQARLRCRVIHPCRVKLVSCAREAGGTGGR
jgi:hypothetical protein